MSFLISSPIVACQGLAHLEKKEGQLDCDLLVLSAIVVDLRP